MPEEEGEQGLGKFTVTVDDNLN